MCLRKVCVEKCFLLLDWINLLVCFFFRLFLMFFLGFSFAFFISSGMEFQFSLPAAAMKHVEQCLKDISRMGKLVKGVATNGKVRKNQN